MKAMGNREGTGEAMKRMRADFDMRDLARALGLRATKTIYRRRLLQPDIYAPDYIDPTHHPRWKPETVSRIVDWERAAK